MIKLIRYCLFCFFILSCKSSIQDKIASKNYSFQVILGSCFNDDEVSVLINNKLLLKLTKVTSDEVLGTAKSSIVYYNGQKKGKFIIKEKNNEKYLDFFIENNIELKVIKNGIISTLKMNVKNGKVIIIDACEKINEDKVTFSQYKKNIFLE